MIIKTTAIQPLRQINILLPHTENTYTFNIPAEISEKVFTDLLTEYGIAYQIVPYDFDNDVAYDYIDYYDVDMGTIGFSIKLNTKPENLFFLCDILMRYVAGKSNANNLNFKIIIEQWLNSDSKVR